MVQGVRGCDSEVDAVARFPSQDLTYPSRRYGRENGRNINLLVVLVVLVMMVVLPPPPPPPPLLQSKETYCSREPKL